MAQRIESEFGDEDAFLKAALNYEVDRLARIEGISQRRAVEIINEVLGNPTQKFLKTERAIQLYEDIIKKLLEHASTDYAQNRVLLLSQHHPTYLYHQRNLPVFVLNSNRISFLHGGL